MPYVKIYYKTRDREQIQEFRNCLGCSSESNVNGHQTIYVRQKDLSTLHEFQLKGIIIIRDIYESQRQSEIPCNEEKFSRNCT